MFFSNYIRAGKVDRTEEMLDTKGKLLLKTWYTFQVNVKKKDPLSDDEYTDGNTATLEVSPLHLAIISQQGPCLDVILEAIGAMYNKSNLQDDTDSPNCEQLLAAKVSVTFPSDDPKLYIDEDQMLDGMNILHLAAKYYPEGLERIICFSQKRKRLLKMIQEILLVGVDNQIKNTPLHVAASSSNVTALR